MNLGVVEDDRILQRASNPSGCAHNAHDAYEEHRHANNSGHPDVLPFGPNKFTRTASTNPKHVLRSMMSQGNFVATISTICSLSVERMIDEHDLFPFTSSLFFFCFDKIFSFFSFVRSIYYFSRDLLTHSKHSTWYNLTKTILFGLIHFNCSFCR